MADYTIRSALTSTKFPYNFSELATTVIVNKGLETQRMGQGSFNGGETDQNQGIPQAYYMENVIPVSRGFTSVSYTQMIPPIPGNPVIDDAFELRGDGTGLALLAVGFQSQYVYDADTAAWVTVNLGAFAPGTVTVANVKGVSYIGVANVGLYIYDFVTKLLVLQTVSALDIGEISGWFAAGANLCAWTRDRIFWSSNLNPLDFTPSLSTGAGSSSILAITSEIVTCLPLGEDFIIYTSTNAVAGRQTSNIQYPFVFSEVVGSSGISKTAHVAYDSNSGIHVAWTPIGFQQVNVQEASFIWPELRDGIARGISVGLDPITFRPEFKYNLDMDVKLQYCSNSYIAVSLRINPQSTVETPYTEAYIYDSQYVVGAD